MSIATYAFDIKSEVSFASSSGVKKGIVREVHVVVEDVSTVAQPDTPPAVHIIYSIDVKNARDNKTHRESVPESLVGADLDGAWTIYLALAA